MLINDPTSPREYVFHENIPPGGHIRINPNGSATIYNRNGEPVSQIAKPWAYDSLGQPQRTWYTVNDNGDLVQHVDPEPNALYPILADPLSGGEDPVTGRPITATPLANGQESIQGEGAGEQIVGNPDPGYSPFQPDPETMLDNREVAVDQGDGTTDITRTDGGGRASTINVPTEQSYQDTARLQAESEAKARLSVVTDEESGQVWRRTPGGDESHSEWTTTVDGKPLTVAVTTNRDGTTTVVHDGRQYTYDEDGGLVSEFDPDPGHVAERPAGPDIGTAADSVLPLPLGAKLKLAVLLQKLQNENEQSQLSSGPGADRGDGRDIAGRFVPRGRAANNAKLAESKQLDRIERTRPGLVRQQRRAVFPEGPTSPGGLLGQTARYYDGLYPNGDGTYTGVEIKSGQARPTTGQAQFDRRVSPETPAKVTLPNGETVLITRVQLFNVPAEKY
ncbi:MAG: hypothetical protein PGN29_01200 [Gordonia paraffinivorans]